MHSTSLIIVNYNTEAHVLEALVELSNRPKELPGQLIVVDNSPENNLAAPLKDLKLDVDYIPAIRNLGFAGGVNLGLECSSGRYIILLNPDARPEQGCLFGLVKMLKDHPDIGVTGPALLPFDTVQSPVPSATRRDPSLLTTMAEYTALHRLLPRDWLQTNYFVMPGSEIKPMDCAMVQGACFAFRRSLLVQAGSFDAERFFLYWEETDFCRRVRALGCRVVYCPQLHCRHLGAASLADGEQDIKQFWQGLYGYHRKHNGVLAAFILRLLLIPGMTAELLILLLSRCKRPDDDRLKRDAARMGVLLRKQIHCRGQRGRGRS